MAAAIGAGAGLWWPVDRWAAWVGLSACAALAVDAGRRDRTVRGRVAAWWVVLLVAMLRAAHVGAAADRPTTGAATALDLPAPRKVAPIQRFRVDSEPERSPGGHRFEARWLATCVPHRGSGLACTERQGRLQVDIAGPQLPVHAGDVVRVPAFTSPPPAYLNPGAYDLRDMWARDGLLGRIRIGHADRLWVEPPETPGDCAP